MEKVYRLLRENVEKGPFTLDELKQQNVRLSDLIWVNGISTAWASATEVSELSKAFKAIIKNTPLADRGHKKTIIEVANGVHREEAINLINKPLVAPHLSEEAEFEQRAEELRKRILAHKSFYLSIPAASNTKDKTKPFVPAIQNNIDIVYYGKKNIDYAPRLLVASLIFILFISVWNRGKLSLNIQSTNSTNIAAKPYVNYSPKALTGKQDSIQSTLSISPILQPMTPNVPAIKMEPKVNKHIPARLKSAASASAVAIPQKQKDPLVEKEETGKATVVINKEPDVVNSNSAPVIEEEVEGHVEQKKSFGKAIKALFKKKNKRLPKDDATP